MVGENDAEYLSSNLRSRVRYTTGVLATSWIVRLLNLNLEAQCR